MGSARVGGGGTGKAATTEWIGGSIVLSRDGHEALVWADRDGALLGATTFRAGEAAERIGESFRVAALGPDGGKRRKPPARVRVASPELADALRREVGPATEVVCAPTPELDVLKVAFAGQVDVPASLGEPPKTYLVAGVTPSVVARTFEAAARMYRAQPWRVMASEDAIVSVTIPELGIDGALLSVVGQMGEGFGLVMFPDRAALEDASARADGELPPHWAMSFMSRGEIGEDVASEVAKHGWKLAGPAAFPALVVVEDDHAARTPNAREMAMFEALATAVAELVESTPDLAGILEREEGIDEAWRIETSKGEVEVAFATEGFDVDEDLRDGGVIDARRAAAFEAELVQRFSLSDAGMMLIPDLVWAETLLKLARENHGVTVTELTPSVVEAIVFEEIPKRRGVEAADARGIVKGLRAFFTYLVGDLGVNELEGCAALLRKRGVEEKVRAAIVAAKKKRR